MTFQNSTIYQIYIRSFNDSNNDGIGDLQGIIQKLDYFSELGVTFLWLTPFYKSPQKDNGYDVANYVEIDPIYGTMADFSELVQKAERRGIGIMIDLVFNHTSTECEWFRKAMDGNLKYKDYYVWQKGKENGKPPTNWISKFGGSVWEYVPKFNEYYLHLFDKGQADLNWNNPSVRKELKEVINFWLQKGVKGFRFDVVNLISKPDEYVDDFSGDGRRFYTDGHRVHEFLKELCLELNELGIVTVGEMSSTSISACAKYSNPAEKELSMCFTFHHLKVDYKKQNKWELGELNFNSLKNLLRDWQTAIQNSSGWLALFWSNHDQPRIVSRFGCDKKYHSESAKMLAGVMYCLRGTPYIYQGEEIGMTNANFTSIDKYNDVESLNYYKILQKKGVPTEEILNILQERSRDNARTPMQWNDELYAGFSGCKPWLDVNDNYKYINVANETRDSHSIFSWYKKLVDMRKQLAVLAQGFYEELVVGHEAIIAYKRKYKEETIIVLANFFEQSVKTEIFGLDFEGYKCILSNYSPKPLEKDIQFKPYEILIYFKAC